MPRNSLIEAYLERLARALLLDSQTKARILDEIRDHLLTAVEEEVRRGHPRAAAEEQALARFGGPKEVAALFSSSETSRLPNPRSRDPARRRRAATTNLRRSAVSQVAQTGKVRSDCCAFCGKPSGSVQRLVTGPEGVSICNECLQLCTEIISSARKQQSSSGDSAQHHGMPTDRASRDARYFCSFCNREHAKVERMIAGPMVFICNICVEEFIGTIVVPTPSS